jgi:hypothetical protein
MPTSPFGQVNPPNRRAMVGDASEHTRFVRITATLAPYLGKGTSPAPTLLGWRDMGASRDARIAAPIFATYKSFIPNR